MMPSRKAAAMQVQTIVSFMQDNYSVIVSLRAVCRVVK